MFVIVWEFLVRGDAAPRFEREYGPDGGWARLFSRSAGYRGTELLRDLGSAILPGTVRYVTVDRWDSARAFEEFKAAHHADYEKLDAACEWLTVSETKIGDFETT